MAKNLLNFAINAVSIPNNISTVTRSSSSNSLRNKTATGLKKDIGSNLNLSLGELTDNNSKFLAPLVTATDPNVNAVQSSVDAAKKTINPKLTKYTQKLDATSLIAAAGISALQGKIPSLNDVINSQFENLGADQIAKRVGYATNVTNTGSPTTINSINSPLSNTLNSLGAATTLMNTVNSFNTLSNTSSPLGKLSAGINLVNSVSQISKSNTQDIAKGLAGAAVSNVIGNKLNVLDNIGLGKNFANVMSKSFGQGLGAFNGTKNIKLFNPSDWVNPDVEAFVTKSLENIENITNTLSSNYELFDSVLTQTGIPKKLGSDGSRKLGNPLREFNGYNYIITLGILSPKEMNFPDEYVKNGISRIICKSGGGQLTKKQTTATEDALGGNLEYFIDNLSIDSVVAANPNTGITQGTAVTFDIIEPYSMGQFLEVIRESANELNFGSFQKLPFCIKIEFVGYDVFGNELKTNPVVPSYLPIMINNVDFEVDGQGSKYAVSAVIYSELVFEDKVDVVLSDISASGKLVHEVLETSEDSITASINGLFETAENKNLISGYDRYVILFPHDSADVYDALNGTGITKDEIIQFYDQEGQRQNDKTLDESAYNTDALKFRQNEANITGQFAQANDIEAQILATRTFSKSAKYYRNLKIWGSRPENINALGLSNVFDDIARHKNTMSKVHANEFMEFETLPEFASKMSYQYRQGSRISQIIEDVVIDCERIQASDKSSSEPGMKDYFKIEQMVFIEDESATNPDLGRPRMTYVYCVVPNKICESKIMTSQEAPTFVTERKASADKEYDYIYSGKNEDILDFNINFNNAFFDLVLADFSKGAAAAGESGKFNPRDQDQSFTTGQSQNKNESTPTTTLGYKNEQEFLNGAQLSSDPEALAKRNRSEQFHTNLINSPINMVTADLSIWGDPYYLPSDIGNKRQKLVGKNLTMNGKAVTRYQDLSIVINFRTPLDYPQLNGAFTMGMPELVKPFSGLFNCWGITHTFNNGQFTQNLSLQRVQNQSNTPTGTGGTQGTSARFTGNRIVGGL